MLECSVCLDTVKDPHTLQQCLHTYCKKCIDQLKQKQNNHPPGVKCPVCWNFSKEGEIRSNFFVKDLVNLHSATSGNIDKICEQCEGENVNRHPEWKCLDCRMLLCDPCKKGHQRVRLLQGHRIIPVSENTEPIVDQLVFCSIHTDKPIELYCEPCKLPLCMTCKVTKHIQHDTKTIDEVLEELVPEMHQSVEEIDKYITANAKSIVDLDAEICELKQAFLSCHERVDETAAERIKEIKAAQNHLKDQLNKKEVTEVKTLEDIKDKLDKKQKEGENLKRVVLTSLDKARHATLLTELVQGGLQDKVNAIKESKENKEPCKINLPKLQDKDQMWNQIKQDGLLGKLVLDMITILVVIGSGVKKAFSSGSRYWENNLEEYFVKPWRKTFEIKLKSECTRVALIRNHIWSPVYGSDCVDIYSKDGQLIKSIPIVKPISVEQTLTNDIFVASQSGLYFITDNDTPVKVCDGHFNDVCYYNDKIYALSYKQKAIWEYNSVNDVLPMRPEKWKETRKIQLNNYEEPHYLDKLLVTNNGHDGGPLYFYVSSCNFQTIYKYSEQGQQIRNYGGPSEQGEAKLSRPYICSIDGHFHILVAESFNNKCKILDPESGQWSDTGLTGEGYVYDAKTDSDGFLWLLQHNRNNFLITKHQQ